MRQIQNYDRNMRQRLEICRNISESVEKMKNYSKYFNAEIEVGQGYELQKSLRELSEIHR